MNPIEKLIDLLNTHHLWEDQKEIKRNDFLTKSGVTDTTLYLVTEGSFRIYVMDGIEENIIRFGYRNNIIAALDSFITEKPADLYIQAIKKSTVKTISKSRFIGFMTSSVDNMKLWEVILSSLIYQQMERERDLLTSSPVERYKRVLSRSPQLFQEIPHKYIASYLRMTPETLSRIKKS